MIRADHDRHGKERCRRITGRLQYEPDDAADHASEGANLQQHMLIEDASTQRLCRHIENMTADNEHQDECQRCHDPRRCRRELPSLLEIEKS